HFRRAIRATTGWAEGSLQRARLVTWSTALQSSPAALRKAALSRSCQPGPPSWKCARTSRSIRTVTASLPAGSIARLGASAAGLVVAFLNRASALSLALDGLRGGWPAILRSGRGSTDPVAPPDDAGKLAQEQTGVPRLVRDLT